MKRVLYALQFKGSAASTDASGTTLNVTAKATSTSIKTSVFPDGLNGKVESEAGAEARFESTVSMKNEGAFDEHGTISFGADNRLRFVTVGQGQVQPSGEEGISVGAVIWRVDGGDGVFAGAAGFITSNFWFNTANEVTDNQFGVIEMK